MLTAILATSKDGTIGVDGRLPWHIPEDLKRFKDLTMGHPVIMGRKTYESIPTQHRPLKGRKNVVVSKSLLKTTGANGCTVVGDLKAVSACAAIEEDPFVIGGAQIYSMLWDYVARVQLTEVHMDFTGHEGATRFLFDRSEWRETARQAFPAHYLPAYDFVTLERA